MKQSSWRILCTFCVVMLLAPASGVYASVTRTSSTRTSFTRTPERREISGMGDGSSRGEDGRDSRSAGPEDADTENGSADSGAEIGDKSDEIASVKEALFGDGDLIFQESDGEPADAQGELSESGSETKETEGELSEAGSETKETEGELSEASGDDSGALPVEQGILKVPDHPQAVTADKLVFIGDSRTVDMMNAVGDDSIWCCKVSMGYQWMVTEGVPLVDGYIDANTAVIIWLGVNDPHNISNYIGYTNQKAAEWAGRGATTYYVSVGPVTSDPYVTNGDIEMFNAALQTYLSGVYYIDIYSYLMENGFATTDGTHYPADVSIAVYNYILAHLEEQRSGIWG